MKTYIFSALVFCCALTDGALSQTKQRLNLVEKQIDENIEHLVPLYKHFHAHPELSLQEKNTSARLAKELRQAGFDVTERAGGYGVVGVLKNGNGPTILVRADMDGLPIIEKTGLPYASKVRTRDKEGQEIGVMHACGHDMNMACLVGTARTLAALKKHWSGTLVFIGQPAEEIGEGARMMLDAGLFKRFPRPDYGFALHCDARFAHGTVNFREGQMQANVDSVDITVRGKGGHGAAPHTTIDPIVLAARVVLDLQTIVSRERNPLQPAVVTVGSIHGGTKHNIIPNEVKLQLTVRTITDQSRKEVLESIVRITKAAALAAKAPAPIVEHDPGSYTPSCYNDPKLTQATVKMFKEILPPGKVVERPMSMGGEDFAHFGRAGVTTFYYHLGTQPPALVAAAKSGDAKLAGVHTDRYYPIPEPTIRTGVKTMSMAVLRILGN